MFAPSTETHKPTAHHLQPGRGSCRPQPMSPIHPLHPAWGCSFHLGGWVDGRARLWLSPAGREHSPWGPWKWSVTTPASGPSARLGTNPLCSVALTGQWGMVLGREPGVWGRPSLAPRL